MIRTYQYNRFHHSENTAARKKKKSMFEQMYASTPPPCDDPCPSRAECKAQELSCEALRQYATSGEKSPSDVPRTPSREQWQNLCENKQGTLAERGLPPQRRSKRKIRDE